MKPVKVIKSPASAYRLCMSAKKSGRTVGLVPTMGALHDGHLSLIAKCAKMCDYLVVSIFVNPAQFGPTEDFGSYPKTFAADRRMCGKAGVDLIFHPSPEDIYPDGYETYVELEKLPEHLCGLKRPGHFKGVATVVLKLFNIIQPDVAVFGRKDYQQLRVIKKMVRDLNVPVKIESGKTVRSAEGLAVSSRNKYLSGSEYKRALLLRKALLEGRRMLRAGKPVEAAKRKMQSIVAKARGKIDYISVCDAGTLDDIKRDSGNTLIALAVKIGRARLIDNIEVGK